MNGRTNQFKRNIMDNFIAKNKPYEKKEPLKFDLRGYAAYIEENHLQASDITPEIMKMFELV